MKNLITLTIIACFASFFVSAQKQVELPTDISRIKNKHLYLENDDLLGLRNIKSVQNTVFSGGENFKKNTNNDFLLDSIYRYDFTSETDSLLNSRVFYEQNEQGSIAKEITEYWNSDTEAWVNHSKIEMEYNEHQELILNILYNWNIADNEWVRNMKNEYDYDVNGYITLQARYFWNINSETWVGNSRYEYERNEQGKATKRITFSWAGDDEEWVYKDKWDYEYNEQFLNTSWIASVWDASVDEWVFSWKSEYEYNEFGEIAREEYFERDNVDKLWQLLAIDEYEFNENGQTQLWISTYYNSNKEEWVYYAKRDYEYDEDDFLILTLRYNWNATDERWIKYSKYEYEYDENGFISVEALYLWNIANEVWTGYRKDEIENNEYGLYTLFIRYSSWDSVNETWIPTSKSENDFNGGSSWEEITYSASYFWDSVNEIWIGTSKTVYEKNELNDILLMTEFDWDYNTNEWALSSKNFYYYSATFSVFVTINPVGAGSVSGEGPYNPGSEATLEAVVNNGFVFKNWTNGEEVVSEDNVYVFTMPAEDVTLTANFSAVTSALEEKIFGHNIRMFPNPAQNHISIEGVETRSTINVFSITGAKLMSLENQSGSVNLDVSRLENGVYVIKINSGNGIVSRKVFVGR
jgi:uncharacterized repeat protein (TIGR02543 family)